MKTLHKIHGTSNLSQSDLSILAYTEKHRVYTDYNFKIEANLLYFRYDNGDEWYLATHDWDTVLTFNEWELDGRPMPNKLLPLILRNKST